MGTYINWDKPIEFFADGSWRHARLIGIVKGEKGFEHAVAWLSRDGKREFVSIVTTNMLKEHHDVRNVVEPRIACINVYEKNFQMHDNLHSAKANANSDMLHMLKINVDTGEITKEPAKNVDPYAPWRGAATIEANKRYFYVNVYRTMLGMMMYSEGASKDHALSIQDKYMHTVLVNADTGEATKFVHLF